MNDALTARSHSKFSSEVFGSSMSGAVLFVNTEGIVLV